ncbi:unnamed protein product, partial [Schistosoma mattheei]
MFFSCRCAVLALPISAFTSESNPPCSSMMLPRYVTVFTSSKASPSSMIRLSYPGDQQWFVPCDRASCGPEPHDMFKHQNELERRYKCSAAELVYGTTLRLPGEFFTPRSRPDFDSVRKPLQQSYEGAFYVTARHEKTFKVDRHGRVEIVGIDRLKPAHVDDSALSDNLRFNARPIKPTSGILKSSSDPTLDTPETSFSRPGQQYASSAPSTDETTVSRPDQQTTPHLTSDEIAGSRDANETTVSRSGRRPTPPTIPIWYRRLWRKLDWPPTLLSTHSVDILVPNVWHTLGLELGRDGRFWFLGSTWFRPTSAAFLVRIPTNAIFRFWKQTTLV